MSLICPFLLSACPESDVDLPRDIWIPGMIAAALDSIDCPHSHHIDHLEPSMHTRLHRMGVESGAKWAKAAYLEGPIVLSCVDQTGVKRRSE